MHVVKLRERERRYIIDTSLFMLVGRQYTLRTDDKPQIMRVRVINNIHVF